MSKNTRRKNTRRKNRRHKNTTNKNRVIYGGGVMDRLKNWFYSSKEKLKNESWFQSAKKNVSDAVDTTNTKIGEGFDSVKNTTTTALSDVLSKTSNAVADAAHSVADTIKPTTTETSVTENPFSEGPTTLAPSTSGPTTLAPSTSGPTGGRKKKRKGGTNISTNAAPVHGLRVATPTYWIKGGKSRTKRKKRSKSKK